jgi:hypothetical protein
MQSKVNVENVLAININILHERLVPVSSSMNQATRGEVSTPLKRKMRLLLLYVPSFAVPMLTHRQIALYIKMGRFQASMGKFRYIYCSLA